MTVIDEAKKALEGVTPGPWGMETVRTSCGVCHKVGPWPHKWRHGADMSACIYDDYPSPPEGSDNMLANARFIAWAREGVPALLAEIAAKDAEIALMRGEFIEATDENFIWGAMDNVHDAETTMADYAAAVSRAQRAALALKGDTHE